jgi:hypothetical protein
MREEQVLGGNLNDAVRIGDTVRRRAGPWTPAVHALLRYLEHHDFDAPRVVGVDDQGREVLEFMPGEAHAGTVVPVPDHVMDEARLIEAAQLLRRYHDVVAGFRPSEDARWRLIAPTAHEIICHNDWSPWNALLRDGHVVVMLDWDLAGPGARVWDVANAAYCWAPLFASVRRWSVTERARRLRLFLDAYGLDDRSEVLAAMRTRLIHVGRFIESEARLGDVGMRRLVEMNVPTIMFENDVRYLDEQWVTLSRALAPI